MLGNFKLVADIVRRDSQEFIDDMNTLTVLKKSATRRRKRVYLRMESFKYVNNHVHHITP